jgi:TetR/AcrR family transcriptional regulator
MARADELSVVARGRRERERIARRDSILAAAQQTFSTRGFAGSTMEEVALRAEITKPTLYGYFHTKDELLLTLMLPVFADIGTQLQAVQRDLEAGLIGSCHELIREYLDAVLTPYRTDPARFRLRPAWSRPWTRPPSPPWISKGDRTLRWRARSCAPPCRRG